MRHCYFCTHTTEIDWKNADLLRNFMSQENKILGPRKTGSCAKHQRKIAKAIKRARIMGILPFTSVVEK